MPMASNLGCEQSPLPLRRLNPQQTVELNAKVLQQELREIEGRTGDKLKTMARLSWQAFSNHQGPCLAGLTPITDNADRYSPMKANYYMP